MLLSPEDTKALSDRILQRSRADHCIVSVSGGDSSNVRFAANNATTNGSVSSLSVTVESTFGQRSGSVTVSGLDEDMLTAAQARSEEIARLAPPNPEYLPPLGPQTYERRDNAYDEATARAKASDLTAQAKTVIDQARSRDVSAAGYGEFGVSFTAMATSAGLFAYDRETQAQLTVTGRNKAQTWSGWASGSELRLASLDASRLGARAIGKADHSAAPLDLDPGKYTVILEPAAVADLVSFMIWHMNARSADEGRSFLTKKGGGTKLGERLVDERVSIISDPHDPVGPEKAFGEDGLPQRRTCLDREWGRQEPFLFPLLGAKDGSRATSICKYSGDDRRKHVCRSDDCGHQAWSSRDAAMVHPHGGPADSSAHGPNKGWEFSHRKWEDRRPCPQFPFQ